MFINTSTNIVGPPSRDFVNLIILRDDAYGSWKILRDFSSKICGSEVGVSAFILFCHIVDLVLF